ncbi:MAG: UvrD-helicase domain-containing protein, partial [Myxococcales bacterium]|nr:UvrD-helicase domain-containing protein [Myxococcales bacterium]
MSLVRLPARVRSVRGAADGAQVARAPRAAGEAAGAAVSGSEADFPDREARRAIRDDLEATLFVEAAAGTGKTTALVGRIASVLRSGRSTLERI